MVSVLLGDGCRDAEIGIEGELTTPQGLWVFSLLASMMERDGGSGCERRKNL